MTFQGPKVAKRHSNRERLDQDIPKNDEMRERRLLEAVMGRVGSETGAVRLFSGVPFRLGA